MYLVTYRDRGFKYLDRFFFQSASISITICRERYAQHNT